MMVTLNCYLDNNGQLYLLLPMFLQLLSIQSLNIEVQHQGLCFDKL